MMVHIAATYAVKTKLFFFSRALTFTLLLTLPPESATALHRNTSHDMTERLRHANILESLAQSLPNHIRGST